MEVKIEQQIIDYIGSKRPLHSKKIKYNLETTPNLTSELVNFLKAYHPYLEANSINYFDLADAYVLMLDQMTCARRAFLRTGRYPASDHAAVVEAVYADKKVMEKYMLGLALSQFLWKHHFSLYSFYRTEIKKIGKVKKALEIGSGHGLFLLELLKKGTGIESIQVVDISAHSLALSKSLISTLKPGEIHRINFINSDIQIFESDEKFDLITMGEVLEHVPDPEAILRSLYKLLSEGGRVYISTCINCPTLDHVYHFRTVKEIHELFEKSGFSIESEVIAPSESRSEEDLEKYKIDISYGALLKKAETSKHG